MEVNGNGSVTPGDGDHCEGSTVLLTATPDAGYVFAGWTGDVSGMDTEISLLMDGDKSVTANFVPCDLTLKIQENVSDMVLPFLDCDPTNFDHEGEYYYYTKRVEQGTTVTFSSIIFNCSGVKELKLISGSAQIGDMYSCSCNEKSHACWDITVLGPSVVEIFAAMEECPE